MGNIRLKTRIPYFLGVVCLIPLIGFIVGLVILIIGLTRHNDKWFIRFGVIGMVWTVLVYSTVFFIFSTKTIKTSFEPFAQKNLDELVKVIEFGKMQHGHYPDSLQQFLTDNQRVLMFDPTHTNVTDNTNGHFFQYEKVNDHYLLFSAGADGIPNTADDLYPNIPVMANGYKFGWVKSK